MCAFYHANFCMLECDGWVGSLYSRIPWRLDLYGDLVNIHVIMYNNVVVSWYMATCDAIFWYFYFISLPPSLPPLMLLWIVMDRDLYEDDTKTGVVMYDSVERTQLTELLPATKHLITPPLSVIILGCDNSARLLLILDRKQSPVVLMI